MSGLLGSLASMLGVVPARRYHALQAQVGELRSNVAEWKSKATEATNRVKTLEGELRRQTQMTEKLSTAADKARTKQGEIDKLRAQLQHAERELAGAREHLMVIEVKLDILEGAANVLDARTRTAVSRQAGGTGAPA
jgi:chromosome segregation ATPase